uniref:Uncharacterized protein n=1 Tax=Tetranychus urticae TaxID=32264 RepID=T1JQE0_TETUR
MISKLMVFLANVVHTYMYIAPTGRLGEAKK